MANLCFGSFTWPNNPETYQEKVVREPVYTENGAGEKVLSGVGPVKRTITGSGTFFGATAYANFKSLQVLADRGEAALLIHPIWGTRKAFLTELVSLLEPRENGVAYSFAFQEVNVENASA